VLVDGEVVIQIVALETRELVVLRMIASRTRLVQRTHDQVDVAIVVEQRNARRMRSTTPGAPAVPTTCSTGAGARVRTLPARLLPLEHDQRQRQRRQRSGMSSFAPSGLTVPVPAERPRSFAIERVLIRGDTGKSRVPVILAHEELDRKVVAGARSRAPSALLNRHH
jgi:hypothetical protein